MSSRSAAYTIRLGAHLKLYGWAKVIIEKQDHDRFSTVERETGKWRSRIYSAGKQVWPWERTNPVSTSAWTWPRMEPKWIWATVHGQPGYGPVPSPTPSPPIALQWNRFYLPGITKQLERPYCPWCKTVQHYCGEAGRSEMSHQCSECGHWFNAIWLEDARFFLMHNQFPDIASPDQGEVEAVKMCSTCGANGCRCHPDTSLRVELKGKPLHLQDFIDFAKAAGDADVSPEAEVELHMIAGSGQWRISVAVEKQPQVEQVTEKVTVTRPPV